MEGNDAYDPLQFARGRPQPDGAALPGVNTPYKASGFADSEVPRLVLILGKDGFKPGGNAYVVLQYMHIGVGEFGFTATEGQVFRYLFADLQPKLVTVHGRNLTRMFDLIGLHRMPWIRQADRDLRPIDGVGDGEPVITRIDISDWKRPELVAAPRPRAVTLEPA